MSNGESSGRQPILVLPEETMRQKGRDAQKSNISAARALSSAIRTTLGPKGMDKMLVGGLGDVTISNDGHTIIDEMDIEHPAAKMIAEVAETQAEEVGDGTTTAVIIAGELLKEAEDLIDQDIHPTIIASGYRMAEEKANQILSEIGEPIDIENDEKLKSVAVTAMTGKSVESSGERLGELAVNAVKYVAEKTEDGYIIDTDDIKIEKQEGGSLDNSLLIEGIIISKDRVHASMPKRVEDANIALINTSIEIRETETDAEIQITDPQQLKSFMDEEEGMIKKMIEKIKESGANVVICQKGIDDIAQHFLAKEGIFAVRRAKKSDMERLSKATGASIVNEIEDLTSGDLGEAGIVEERKISGEEMTFIEECKMPKAVSVLVRGGTEHVVNEAERSLDDAISVVSTAIEKGKIVAGGGATEIELSLKLREYADTIGGREALAIRGFADAIETVVRTLAENSGLDPIDILVDLRAKHEDNATNKGLDVKEGEIVDMIEENVIEPLRIKTQAISSGSEAAIMILRIDDVIAASEEESSGHGGAPSAPGMGSPGGMPAGMPGMG